MVKTSEFSFEMTVKHVETVYTFLHDFFWNLHYADDIFNIFQKQQILSMVRNFENMLRYLNTTLIHPLRMIIKQLNQVSDLFLKPGYRKNVLFEKSISGNGYPD